MLKLDMELVDKKVRELYPRFKKGMKNAEVEQELAAQRIDKQTIDFIIRKLEQKLVAQRHGGDSTPILILSFIAVILLTIVMIVYFRSGFLLISVGIASAFFMFIKVLNQWLDERRNQ